MGEIFVILFTTRQNVKNYELKSALLSCVVIKRQFVLISQQLVVVFLQNRDVLCMPVLNVLLSVKIY